MFYFIHQISHIIKIHFLFNQSYLHYYLLLCFLLWSYWPFLIPIFDYVLFYYFIFKIQIMTSFMKFKSLLWFLPSFLLLVIQSRWVFPYPSTMVPYHCHKCLFLYFIILTSRMSATTQFDGIFHQNYFDDRSYYHYI